jgi:hypothetical protein
MHEEIIFSDYSGTFSDHSELWGLVKGIITGISWREYEKFREKKIGPGLPIYFYPGQDHETDMVAIATWKADIINKIGVTRYYEDDSTTINVLKILCPKCKIVQVYEGRTSI